MDGDVRVPRIGQYEMAEDIPLPLAKRELNRHLFYKGVQMGSVLGVAIAPVLMLARRQPVNIERLGSIAFVGMAIGPPLSLAAGAARMYNQPDIGYQDRAYRLARNTGQNLVDAASLQGAVAGSAFFALYHGYQERSAMAALRGLGNGAALGVAMSVLIHACRVAYRERSAKMPPAK